MNAVRSLVGTWLLLDFFGESRRSRSPGSTLTTTIFTQSFLALVLSALLFPETPPVAFAAAALSFSTLLYAVAALGETEAAARTRADAVLLQTSPLAPWQRVAARCLHGSFRLVLCTVGMALPPAILLAMLTGDALAAVRHLVAACACSAIAGAALTVCVQFTARLRGPDTAALLSGTLRALALGLGLVAFALGMRHLDEGVEAMPFPRWLLDAMPMLWAARAVVAPAANPGAIAGLLAAGTVLLVMLRFAGEGASARSRRRSSMDPFGSLEAWLARDPVTRGITSFTGAMLWRNPGFRSRAVPLFGVPAAMVYLGLQGAAAAERELFLAIALQFPAIYLPFLVALLPRGEQPEASWVFAQSPSASLAHARQATFIALSVRVLLPLHALALLAMLFGGIDPWFALPLSLTSLGGSALLARLQARALQHIPFTQANEGQAAAELGSLLVAALLLLGFACAWVLAVPPAVRWIFALQMPASAFLQLRARS